jgi:hypothetical protein
MAEHGPTRRRNIDRGGLIDHGCDLQSVRFSTQPEERKNEHDDDNQADQVDQSVHKRLHDMQTLRQKSKAKRKSLV